MAKLKPDFIATARAIRRHTNRLGHGSYRQFDLIMRRLNRLHRLYSKQIKIPA